MHRLPHVRHRVPLCRSGTSSLNVVRKCDACKALRENGEQPACVAACPMRALEFGPIDELIAAHPDAVKDIVILPDSETAGPYTIIDAKAAALEGSPKRSTCKL